MAPQGRGLFWGDCRLAGSFEAICCSADWKPVLWSTFLRTLRGMGDTWTLEQDEELRAACERAGGDLSLKKIKWWEELARGFPGSSAKGLQQVPTGAHAPRLRWRAPVAGPGPALGPAGAGVPGRASTPIVPPRLTVQALRRGVCARG